jgi:hypothetical protein
MFSEQERKKLNLTVYFELFATIKYSLSVWLIELGVFVTICSKIWPEILATVSIWIDVFTKFKLVAEGAHIAKA